MRQYGSGPVPAADKIPYSAGVVLHLGCGDGSLLAGFRRRNPASRLIGIEADPVLARRASAVLDEVYCLDAEAGPLPGLVPVDCIVLAPAAGWSGGLVAELGRMLAPGGVVVAWMAEDASFAGTGLYPLDAEVVGPGEVAWRIGAVPVAPLRIVSTMLPPIGGVSQVRVVEPLAALAAEPGAAVSIVNHLDTVPALESGAGIFILHRPALLGAAGLERVRALIARGWVVVCEFDDHPSQIPVLHRSDVQNFRAVHAIQTSTPALAEVLGRENPEIAVFPNAIAELPVPGNFVDPGGIIVMFAALNREEDWPEHIEALNRAAAAAGAALRFQVIADQAFFDALDTPYKAFTPLSDYDTYLRILSRCEVSFMPLRDTMFNRCKSDLKYLEAAAHRAVALASPTVYAGSIRDGENGLIFDGAEALYARLMRLVGDRDGARALAERGRDDVARHRMLAYQVRGRMGWYRDLWARRAELQAALGDRVEELK